MDRAFIDARMYGFIQYVFIKIYRLSKLRMNNKRSYIFESQICKIIDLFEFVDT